MAEWHKRGWLAPSGTLHGIEREGTHTDWLLAHPEHWEAGKHQEALDRISKGEGKHYAVREANARMLRHGWVRQAGRGMYELGDRRHLRKVLDHVMTNYPDIDHVTVDIGVDAPTTHTIAVHEETIPLGQCYSWATKHAQAGDTIVHGTVQHPWDGHAFSHAWIERGDRIHDFQTSIGLGPGKRGWAKASFQDAYKPSQTRRYAPEQAKAQMLRHGHHGPWEEVTGVITAYVESLMGGAKPRQVIEQMITGLRPGQHLHPNQYPWHDGHTRYGRGQLLEDEHEWNDQAVKGRVAGYHDIARHFGHVVPNAGADLKHYDYRAEHAEKIDRTLKGHGYTAYYAGGKYGQPALHQKNYDSGHLMIWNPDEGSGGDFGHRAYTDAWRKMHELAHAITKPIVNAKYGEAQRIGKLGHHRSMHEAERSVEWEWHAAHKQRELSAQIGVHVPDHVFHKELNTVMHDAVHRAVTGKFTNPEQEGYVPHGHKVPLETSLGLIRHHAQRMGLTDRHQTLKNRPRVTA